MKCLLVGNFGVGNLGDEALKEYFLQEFSDVDWTVISATPKGSNEVVPLPGGVRSFLRFKWLSTITAYRNCDAVVFGGGSLFTDTESVFACFIWWVHAQFGFLLGKPVHLAFQGIGPFRTRLGARFARAVCRKSQTISVRDSLSFSRVGEWGLSSKCVQTCDPVFSLIKSHKVTDCSKNVLILIPRKNSGDKFMTTAQEFVKSMHPDEVRIISMQPDKRSEMEYCQKLASSIDTPTRIQKVSTLNDLIQEVSKASFVISERYHGAIVALALGKEVEIVSQCDGDKLSTLSIDSSIDLEKVNIGVLHLRESLEIE